MAAIGAAPSAGLPRQRQPRGLARGAQKDFRTAGAFPCPLLLYYSLSAVHTRGSMGAAHSSR